ncbi:holin [Schinkia azotoformans]|uniref:holin n=1 Tax=Schinkia azotoformans TaxID=1454 RepID=UPI002DBFED35|nr:holin [Schinkia azotoformans]MEC1716584.1 holin [Schinkia azotoformans]MEC1739422.1 holin [Schinkia azotoformans]MEC1745508.1 holin [Schinkia azotoformans]MEC1756571.1 holin [Schinkia azotoformans]MEC1765838.1 holin [Schinkia azotoformans]
MFEIAIIIAVVIALTQLIKKLDLMPVKYLPALSLLLGIMAGYFYVDVPTVAEKIMFGLMIGLSAAGLFDQSKIITKK